MGKDKRRPREYIHTRMDIDVGRRERGNKRSGDAHMLDGSQLDGQAWFGERHKCLN